MKYLVLISALLTGCAQPSECPKVCNPYIKFNEDGSRVTALWNRCHQAEVDISQCESIIVE